MPKLGLIIVFYLFALVLFCVLPACMIYNALLIKWFIVIRHFFNTLNIKMLQQFFFLKNPLYSGVYIQ